MQDADVEQIAGGPGTDACSGLPAWRRDVFTYSVPLPEASDDVGVAAFALRITTDAGEFFTDFALVGTSKAELTTASSGAAER